MGFENIRQAAQEYITQNESDMIGLCDYLGEHPEISSQEFESSKIMAKLLKDSGFKVEYPFDGIPTAFSGTKTSKRPSSDRPVAAIMVEYDALPEIGHACGHNNHGTMALYAGMALGSVINELDGEIRVIGTPAEEDDGAKAKMAEDGVFDDVDFAVMFHAYGGESFTDDRALGLDGYTVTFRGRASHSAASPWMGRSAQNAMLLFMDALNMMRLHMHDYCRLHAVIKEVSGAVNIIPDTAVCQVETRAPDRKMLAELTRAMLECAKGAATATGTEVSYQKFMRSFDALLPNRTAETFIKEIMEKYGVVCTTGHLPTGSTDVGNVSYKCPAIQPEFAVTARQIDLHTKEFAEAAVSDEGHKNMIKGARIMADSCLQVLTDAGLREKIRNDFNEALADADY